MSDRKHSSPDMTEEAVSAEADTATAEVDSRVESASSESSASVSEVEALREELEATRNRLLRTAAEYQNFRRRTEEQRRLWGQQGRQEVVAQLLDVYDDFRRSLEAAQQAEGAFGPEGVEGFVRGVSLIYDKFSEAMKKLNVEPIPAVGEPFDPDVHHALARQPAPEGTPPDTIVAEIQRGYRMGDRVLRHPQVIVAQ